ELLKFASFYKMSNLIKKEYRIKEDVVKAQFSPDIQEYISRDLFDTRIRGFNTAIKSCAVSKSFYVSLYIFTTLLALFIGIPVTVSNDYKYYGWYIFFMASMCAYLIALCIHLVKMKEVEKVMERVNGFDNINHIFWKLEFTDSYVMEGYRKKYYFVILELSSPAITQQVTVNTVISPPAYTAPTAPTHTTIIPIEPTSPTSTAPTSTVPQQQIILITGNTSTLPLSDGTQTTQIISIDHSQLNQILAITQQQQHQDNLTTPPTPPPKD
ncbi:5106_t:CDS:2, partial [Racocetra persica]